MEQRSTKSPANNNNNNNCRHEVSKQASKQASKPIYALALDLASHGNEGTLNVCGVLGTGLQERDATLVGERLVQTTAPTQKRTRVGRRRSRVTQHQTPRLVLLAHKHAQPAMHTLASAYSTARFASKSHLLPTKSLLTFGHAKLQGLHSTDAGSVQRQPRWHHHHQQQHACMNRKPGTGDHQNSSSNTHRSISFNHCFTFSKLSRSVMSYT